MEALYSKLYDKYTKLKTKKESEIDKINSDQEVKFMNCVSAAEQLIEHLRNENDRLRAEINELRSEVASIRTTKDELHDEYQKLVMQENQKNKELSIEIERLQNLQPKGFHSSAGESKTGNGSLLVGSDTLNSDANVRRKRRRDCPTATEFISTPCNNDQLECAAVIESESDLSKQTVPSGTGLNIDQPMCCRRKIGLSGSDLNVSDPANCMFQDLIECLVGMKLSTVAQTDGVCISVLHQSSGYSFSLTWVNKAGVVEEAELLYRVMSLGTFERVAPEWMREVLMFSTKMCPIFFERLSYVINRHC